MYNKRLCLVLQRECVLAKKELAYLAWPSISEVVKLKVGSMRRKWMRAHMSGDVIYVRVFPAVDTGHWELLAGFSIGGHMPVSRRGKTIAHALATIP